MFFFTNVSIYCLIIILHWFFFIVYLTVFLFSLVWERWVWDKLCLWQQTHRIPWCCQIDTTAFRQWDLWGGGGGGGYTQAYKVAWIQPSGHTTQQRHYDAKTTSRRFDVIMTLSLRHVPVGLSNRKWAHVGYMYMMLMYRGTQNFMKRYYIKKRWTENIYVLN